MTEYLSRWSGRKRAAKAAEVASHLRPGEEVIYQGSCLTWDPVTKDLVITDRRVFTYAGGKLGVNLELEAIVRVSPRSGTISLAVAQGEIHTLSSIPWGDRTRHGTHQGCGRRTDRGAAGDTARRSGSL